MMLLKSFIADLVLLEALLVRKVKGPTLTMPIL